MRLGPVHVVTDSTMDWMQAALHRLSVGLSDANADRERLIRLVAELVDERDRLLIRQADPQAGLHRLMHHPGFAHYSPTWIAEPDPDDGRSQDAAMRVTEAYQRTITETKHPDAGMWIHAERRNQPFIHALRRGDWREVQKRLSTLFQTSLIDGLGRFHHSMPMQLASPGNQIQLQFADVLLSLAEALAVQRVTSAEQDATEHRHSLDVDPDRLAARIIETTQFDLQFPQVGGSYGCRVGNESWAIDSVVHGYTVARLKQLGARTTWRVAEIGGGYGCLAMLSARHGVANWTIYDLPWVNAIQGYFLIMSLPQMPVRLFGESLSGPAVMPYWRFPDESSVDVVVNTDSLPEIGPAAAREYIKTIGRITRRFFLSINQEGKSAVEACPDQQCVAELIRECSGMTTVSRQRYWMRPGYVEELFVI